MIALVKEAHRPADPIRCHIPPGRIAHGTIWWIFHTVFCRIQRAVIEILTKKGQAFPAYRQRPSASRAADIVHTSERHPQGMCRKTADHSTMTQSRTSCSSAGRMLLSASLYILRTAACRAEKRTLLRNADLQLVKSAGFHRAVRSGMGQQQMVPHRERLRQGHFQTRRMIFSAGF